MRTIHQAIRGVGSRRSTVESREVASLLDAEVRHDARGQEVSAKRPELLEATDETIVDAMEHADPMVLRGLLYQLTGDEELIEVRLASGSGERGRGGAAVAE